MNDTIDSAKLLRDYAATGTEAAFAEVVRRHMDLVHCAALRRSGGNAALAAEVAQTVFTDLALKARSPGAHEAGCVLAAASLAGWLYRHTCFVAATAVRTESRRRAREETAMQLQAQSDSTDWSHVAPVLEEAMAELPDLDRDALVLRFFEKESFAHVGATLGASEDAARMRVDRALDKLRGQLARRGVTSTAAALATSLATFGVTPAPVGLAATVAVVATAGALPVAAGAVPFLAFKPMTVVLSAALAMTTLLTGLYFASGSRARLAAAKRDLAALTSELARLRTEQDAGRPSAVDPDELARWRQEHAELLQLRGSVARLRRELAEAITARTADTNAATVASDENASPVQVTIEAKFFELPDTVLKTLGLAVPLNGSFLMPEPSATALLQRLKQLDGVELMSAPKVTTLSGRQAQIMIMADTEQDTASNGAPASAAAGPSFSMDVIPYVKPGNREVELSVIAAGYVTPSADEPGAAPESRTISGSGAHARLWDGQSVLLRQPAQHEANSTTGGGPRSLLILVTPTCIDPAGRRLFAAEGTNPPPAEVPDQLSRGEPGSL